MANVSSSNGLEKCPKLRFPGFDEPWKTNIFDEIFSLLPNNTLSRADLASCGDVLNVHYGDVLIKYGSILDVESDEIPYIAAGKENRKQCYLSDGDVIIADTAEDETVGKCTEITNTKNAKIEAGLHTIPCHPRTVYAPMFLGYYMNSPYYHKQLIPLMQGVKVLSVSKSNIGNTLISAPTSYSEQEKIVELLHLLDCRMRKQQEVIDNLKKYKRGLSNYLFDRLLTEEKSQLFTFGDVMTILQNNTFSRDNLSVSNDGVRNIHYGDVLIKYGASLDLRNASIPVIKPIHDISKFSASSYLQNGDIVFADTAEDYTVGKATEIFGANNIPALSGLHTIPCRPQKNFVPMYLGYYFNSDYFKKQLYPMIQGTKVSSISKSEIVKTKMVVPCQQEQTRIASILSALDKRICTAEAVTKGLAFIRQGLLQQLFI